MHKLDGIYWMEYNQRAPNDIHTMYDTYQWLITGILNSQCFLFPMEVSLGSGEEGYSLKECNTKYFCNIT